MLQVFNGFAKACLYNLNLRITKARNERNKEEITWPKRVITTTVTLAAAAVPTSKMTIWVDCKNENSRLRNFSHKPAKTTSALISTSIPSSSSSSSSSPSSSQSSTTTTPPPTTTTTKMKSF
ncbi:hypothetical protein GQX74_007871 [Glossina fuscipes]|nr:hypothetical protein GQX74_007871 [Glossina fuscipes]